MLKRMVSRKVVGRSSAVNPSPVAENINPGSKVVVEPTITVEDIIGAPQVQLPVQSVPLVQPRPMTMTPPVVVNPDPASFNGFVDDRIIPDAGLPTEKVEGVLDLNPNGHGYLRPERMPSNHDIYISSSQIRRFQLRAGDIVGGQARKPKDNERYWGLLKVETINGEPAEQVTNRPWFDQLTPVFPDKQLVLETEKEIISTRMIDLISPIGMGQRGLIVSPPKAGKTWLIKDIG